MQFGCIGKVRLRGVKRIKNAIMVHRGGEGGEGGGEGGELVVGYADKEYEEVGQWL